MTDTTLQQLFPLGKEVQIADKALRITPFKLGELPRVFKAVEPITALVVEALGSTQNQMTSLAKIMVGGGDNVIDLLAIGSRQPRAWIDELELDAGVELLAVVIEVNASFFVQRVLPILNREMAKAVPQTGQSS
jgi:hypothetical protein